MQMSPQAPPYTDTPPAYSEIYQPRYVLPHQVPGQVAQMSSHYPGAQMFMPMQHMPVGQMGQNVPMAYYPMGAMYPHGSTVMVDSSYDAGARFTAGSGVSIPPPPPGHPPNAAQLAAMQGANVVMAQRKNNFFLGGSSGGYTICLVIVLVIGVVPRSRLPRRPVVSFVVAEIPVEQEAQSSYRQQDENNNHWKNKAKNGEAFTALNAEQPGIHPGCGAWAYLGAGAAERVKRFADVERDVVCCGQLKLQAQRITGVVEFRAALTRRSFPAVPLIIRSRRRRRLLFFQALLLFHLTAVFPRLQLVFSRSVSLCGRTVGLAGAGSRVRVPGLGGLQK
ncbi:hypothetical protein FQN60_002262, partial [Etheostoma spectabile]